MTQHSIITIHGGAQGVGFRYAAKQKADELKLAGFARNESDGTVRIEIEGNEKNVQEFIIWCREGVATASVRVVNVAFEKKMNNFSGFVIQ